MDENNANEIRKGSKGRGREADPAEHSVSLGLIHLSWEAKGWFK